MKNERNSRVELLRILSMLSIVAIHYLGINKLENLAIGEVTLAGELFILIKTLLT